MTKDKLEKEAGESWWNDNNCSGALSTKKIYICGYLASAEPREKRIAELEAQIEKMKCCEMCKHKNFNWGFSPICEARDKIKIKNPLTCKCDKWEIKEND